LITTELVINSLKHAFRDDIIDGQITVAFDVSGINWKLSVADNGVGRPDGVFAQAKSGLGTGIVIALAKQIDAKVDTVSGQTGTTVSITHATFPKAERHNVADHTIFRLTTRSRAARRTGGPRQNGKGPPNTRGQALQGKPE
jgi:two-component sensor histidine kinase